MFRTFEVGRVITKMKEIIALSLTTHDPHAKFLSTLWPSFCKLVFDVSRIFVPNFKSSCNSLWGTEKQSFWRASLIQRWHQLIHCLCWPRSLCAKLQVCSFISVWDITKTNFWGDHFEPQGGATWCPKFAQFISSFRFTHMWSFISVGEML